MYNYYKCVQVEPCNNYVCKSYNLDDDPTTVTDTGIGEGSGTLNLNDHYSYRLYCLEMST